MSFARRTIAVAALLSCVCIAVMPLASLCLADSWGAPPSEHKSPNGKYALKVQWPKGNPLTLVEKASSETNNCGHAAL